MIKFTKRANSMSRFSMNLHPGYYYLVARLCTGKGMEDEELKIEYGTETGLEKE